MRRKVDVDADSKGAVGNYGKRLSLGHEMSVPIKPNKIKLFLGK